MSGANQLVAEVGGPTRLQASASARAGRGSLMGIWVSSVSGSPTITVYDNTAGSGTVIVGTFVPEAAKFYPLPFSFVTGCFVVLGGTVDCTVGTVGE